MNKIDNFEEKAETIEEKMKSCALTMGFFS